MLQSGERLKKPIINHELSFNDLYRQDLLNLKIK